MDPGLRDRVFARDRWTCQLQGRADHVCRGALHCHHIRLRSQGGTDAMENLATLCMAGHDWVHGHPMEAERLGLIRRRAV